MKLFRFFLFSLLAALPVAVTCDNTARSSELGDTDKPVGQADDDAMREMKELQDQADFEVSQEIIREKEDAERAKILDEQEAGLGSEHPDHNGERVNQPVEQTIPPPGPGLRYRKAPVDDDILVSRRKTRVPPVRATQRADPVTDGPAAVPVPADGVASGGASAPASETRKKVMANDDDQMRRVRMEFSKQRQMDHSAGVPAQEESPVESTETVEAGQTVSMEDPQSYINSASEEFEDLSSAYYSVRYRIPRQWGRPVEAILKHNIKESMGRRSTSTLYDVLGVSSSTSIGDIKKTFRQKSLSVHPDKNPHPDARLAFDLLSDAHDILSDEETRQIYDERLQLARSVHNPFKLSNIRRKFSCFLDNFTSRLLLFFARVRRGQWKEEVEDFLDAVKLMPVWNLKRDSVLLYKRFALLPTWQDRFDLFGEIVWTWKIAILVTSVMTFSLSKTFLLSMNKVDNYYYDAM